MEVGVKTERSVNLEEDKLEKRVERLLFHQCCGTCIDVINNGLTARRLNPVDDYNNGVVLTSRPLRKNEIFEVRLDKIVTKWIGSIEIGVTTHSPVELAFPSRTNSKFDTWIMTGHGVMKNGIAFIHHYGQNLDKLQVGDRVGVMKNDNSALHFYVNGEDQGEVVTLAKRVYGLVNLYGQAVEATIVDDEHFSNLRFHHLHGKNARITNNGLTASRTRALERFNDAVVIGNRTLRDGEIFQVSIDKMIDGDRWYGAIEVGVTTIKPNELTFPSTMTDVDHETWMLSGSSFIRDGITLKSNYMLDLDKVREGNRVGIMRSSDSSLNYYLDGTEQGIACLGIPLDVYPVIDLYGQCTQVTIILPDCEEKETNQQKRIFNQKLFDPITPMITNDTFCLQSKYALVEEDIRNFEIHKNGRNIELINRNSLRFDCYTQIEIKSQAEEVPNESKEFWNRETICLPEFKSQKVNECGDDSCFINCINFIQECLQCTVL